MIRIALTELAGIEGYRFTVQMGDRFTVDNPLVHQVNSVEMTKSTMRCSDFMGPPACHRLRSPARVQTTSLERLFREHALRLTV